MGTDRNTDQTRIFMKRTPCQLTPSLARKSVCYSQYLYSFAFSDFHSFLVTPTLKQSPFISVFWVLTSGMSSISRLSGGAINHATRLDNHRNARLPIGHGGGFARVPTAAGSEVGQSPSSTVAGPCRPFPPRLSVLLSAVLV